VKTAITIAVAVLLSPLLLALVVLSVATAVVLLPLLCAWGILTDWCQTENDSYDY
jgi:hypothetical protein